ncbi:hypothetical protein GCM10018790_63510 [Kitasatospora xanthocidica]|nr:hypothetical protein GCM10018790_63510 [Kitasatospora xanthocidica]
MHDFRTSLSSKGGCPQDGPEAGATLPTGPTGNGPRPRPGARHTSRQPPRPSGGGQSWPAAKGPMAHLASRYAELVARGFG